MTTEHNNLIKKQRERSSIAIILGYAWRSRKSFILMLLFMGLGIGFTMVMPQITGQAVKLISQNTADLMIRRQFILMLLLGLGITLVGILILGAGRYFSADVGTNAQYYIRKDIYTAINRQTYSFFNENETGDLISRATSDIETMQPVFNQGITISFQSLITMLGVIVAIFIINPSIAWIPFTIIALFFLLIYICAKKMQPAYFQSREVFGDLTTVFRENIIGANVVRIFNAQDKERHKFDANNYEFQRLSIIAIRWTTILRYSAFGLIALLYVFGIGYGIAITIPGNPIAAIYGIEATRDNLGAFVTLIGYMGIITSPFMMLNNVVMHFVSAGAAMKRVREVLVSMPEITQKSDAISADRVQGHLEFKNVNFGYTSALVLKNITFDVPPNSTIAILGTTGSGKSTLISLLPRFYDPTTGEILLDGVDLRDYQIDGLRQQIGVCSQDIFLFNKSVSENIRYGREEATQEEIMDAAKSANIHEFILTLPEGYDTLIGERGASLSGGQKQRIAIARALIMQPRILILDDSTSSVDMETEYKIQEALERVMKNRTTFIITQRISTIRNAEKILVMDQGRIIGYGTHTDLIQSNPLYIQIFETLFEKQKSTPQKETKPMTAIASSHNPEEGI